MSERISDRGVQRIIDGRATFTPQEMLWKRVVLLAEDLRDARFTIERLTRAAEAKETERSAAPNAADAE